MLSYQKTKGCVTVLKCVASVVFTCFLLCDLSCNDCGLCAELWHWIMRWKSQGGGVNIDIVEISCQWVHNIIDMTKRLSAPGVAEIWCLNKWVEAASGPQSLWGLYHVSVCELCMWTVSITRCVSSVNTKTQRFLCSTLKACLFIFAKTNPQVWGFEPMINYSIWLDWR